MTRHALRYLKENSKAMLFFPRGSGPLLLQGYVDADYASTEGQKSITGYVFFANNSTISWSSQRQQCVAISSSEAEYVALKAAVQEAIWIRRLLANLGHPQTKPTVLFEDNQTCISFTKPSLDHKRSKHIDVAFHFTHKQIHLGNIIVEDIRTEKQVADVFTKIQTKARFQWSTQQMGMVTQSPST